MYFIAKHSPAKWLKYLTTEMSTQLSISFWHFPLLVISITYCIDCVWLPSWSFPLCEAHNCCESVLVTLCSAGPDGNFHTLATEHLHFVQDLAFDMAQFLVSAVGQMNLLEEALLLDEHQIPLQECEKLDQSLSLALKHITLPPGWSLLGNNTRECSLVEASA